MTDRDVAALLEGIDAPRPLPEGMRSDLEAELTGVAAHLSRAPTARPVPEDLRRRLEASLLETAPLPPRLDRRLTATLARPRPGLVRLTAAVAALVLVAGVLVTTTREAGDQPVATGTTEGRPSAGAPRAAGPPPVTDGSEAALGDEPPAPPPFVDLPPTGAGTPSGGPGPAGAEGGAGQAGVGAGADAAPAAGSSTGGAPELQVAVDGGDAVAGEAFRAYLRLLNDAGGVNGRPLRTVGPDEAEGAVASVNLGPAPIAADGGVPPPWVRGLLFETVHVDDAPLRGAVTSLASPLEAQARLAVRQAFPDPALGRRAAVYVGSATPWADHVAAAFEAELRGRGVTPVRVPFDGGTPAFVAADAVFLSLPPEGAASWVEAASGRPPPPLGTWGVASAWDDAFVAAAAGAALHVLSPYAPASGEELRALRDAIDRPLSVEAVHGWVTAKAIAYLLFENGGSVLSEASIDRLDGWPSSWSPPFETRQGTRARTPEAVRLAPDADGFRAEGQFQRDG